MPAMGSMMTAAMRVIQVSGMTFSRPRPPTIAMPATAHSARAEPMPTDSGSW